MEQHNSLVATHPATERSTAQAQLQRRLSALRKFEFRLADEAPDVEAQNTEWESYVLGLEDQCYGRELSELEERYEWSKWLRAQSMLEHRDDFSRLLDVVYEFVVALTDSGGQRFLGERAGLPSLSPSARPSDWVKFGPVFPPDHPPIAIAEYERLSGGPHVLGARLIWWCAAAKIPRDFGFSGGFSLSLCTQPIWVTTCGRSTRANQYPLSLMRETAAELVRLAKSGSPEQSSAVEDGPAMLEDGPHDEGVFVHRGVTYIFPPTLWGLLNYMWQKRWRRAYLEDAIDDLWGENASKGALESAVFQINKRFNAQGLPFHMRIKSPHVFLEGCQV